jgi:hypothetical protein
LVLADQTQGFGKVLLKQEAAVLGVGQGPDLSKSAWRTSAGRTHLAEDGFGNSGPLEKLDGRVTGDNVGAALVAFAKELAKELSLVRSVVELWMGNWTVSRR